MGHGGNVTNGKILISKFTEDLVGSVVHVLDHRQQLRGWTQKKAPGCPPRVQVLAAQLFSEMKLQGKCPVWARTLRPWLCGVVPRRRDDCSLGVTFRNQEV